MSQDESHYPRWTGMVLAVVKSLRSPWEWKGVSIYGSVSDLPIRPAGALNPKASAIVNSNPDRSFSREWGTRSLVTSISFALSERYRSVRILYLRPRPIRRSSIHRSSAITESAKTELTRWFSNPFGRVLTVPCSSDGCRFPGIV